MTRINPDGWSDSETLTRGQLSSLDRKQADALHVSSDQVIWGNPNLVNATLENATCNAPVSIESLGTPENTIWTSTGLLCGALSCDSVTDGRVGGAVIGDAIPASQLLCNPWQYSTLPIGGGYFAAGWVISLGTSTVKALAIPSRCLSHGGRLSNVTVRFYSASIPTGEAVRIRLFHGAECLSVSSSSTSGSNLFSASTTPNSTAVVNKDSGDAYWLEITSAITASITAYLMRIEFSYSQYGEPSWVRGGG